METLISIPYCPKLRDDPQRKKESSFDVLYKNYHSLLFQSIFQIIPCVDCSKDVLQEVFIKLWINKEKLSEVENISAYLFTVSKNMAISHLRKEKRRRNLLDSYTYFHSLHQHHYYPLEEKELLESLSTQVDQLPIKQKQVYTLKNEGFRMSQIAREMKLSPLTVKTHLNAARKKIKKKMREEQAAEIQSGF